MDLTKAMRVIVGPRDAQVSLQEVMDTFFVQLAADQTATALFKQCDDHQPVDRTLLPPLDRSMPATWQTYEAVGRILAKCMLEGIHVPITFCSALHCFLVDQEILSQDSHECIAMMAEFDPDEARRLVQVLSTEFGDGQEIQLIAGSILGNDNDNLVTDANKEGLVCCKVRSQLLRLLVLTHEPHCNVPQTFW